MFGSPASLAGILPAAVCRRACTAAIAYKEDQALVSFGRLRLVAPSFCVWRRPGSTMPERFMLVFPGPSPPATSDPDRVVHAHLQATSCGLPSGSPNNRRDGIRQTIVSALRTHISQPHGKLLHACMLKHGFERDTFLLNLLVSMYGKCGALDSARFVFENMEHRNVVSCNAMIAAYTRCGALEDARSVFDCMLERNVVSWNTLIAAYTHQRYGRQALCFFKRMQQEGQNPNNITFLIILSACASLEVSLLEGQAIHVNINGLGFQVNLIVGTALVNMYGKFGDLDAVHSVFCQLEQHDVVLWTALISTYAQQGHWKQALISFRQMQLEGVEPNKVTFISILSACASLCSLLDGKTLHLNAISAGFEPDTDVRGALINMYGKCGRIDYAWSMFDSSRPQGVILWNAMVTAYIHQGHNQQALQLFRQMQKRCLNPNEVTLVNMLTACASLTTIEEGMWFHTHLVDGGYVFDTVVGNALINMYGKCKALENARSVFEKMTSCNVVSWTSLISAYSQEGHAEQALDFFQKMQQEGVKPNEVTFISILCACASLAALEGGRAIHVCIFYDGTKIAVGNAIVNMYGKCGALEDARSVFDQLQLLDIFSWNAMIAAYAQGGHGKEALLYFWKMQQEGVKPSDITFISLLSACSHAGLVDEGCFYFDFMRENYGIPQMLEHHVCMIDLFGRAGQLENAENLAWTLSLTTDACLGSSLLASCRIHGCLKQGKHAAEHMFESDPQIVALYVLLSSIMLQGEARH